MRIKEKLMNFQKFGAKSKLFAGGLIVALGLTGWGVARASQSLFTPGVHISMKMADPAEGPSQTGFAHVVKGVLPDVVNISTSKIVKTPAQGQFEFPDGMPPFFQQSVCSPLHFRNCLGTEKDWLRPDLMAILVLRLRRHFCCSGPSS
jgi:S1-C subfamily serine protease